MAFRDISVQWALGRLIKLLAGEFLLLLLNSLCYDDPGWMAPLQVLLIPYYSICGKRERFRRKAEHEKGFRELLQSLMTSIQAGYSLENACRAALNELAELHMGKQVPVVRQMRKIVNGIEFHIPIEKLFTDYAREADSEDIYEFAVVLDIAKNTGGNIVEIIREAMLHLQQKMDAAEEIRIILSGKILEKNIMFVMPFGILFYLKVTNPEYVDCFYHSIVGHFLMSIIIAAVIACFYWTENIIKMEI